jgi:hypothetical protein
MAVPAVGSEVVSFARWLSSCAGSASWRSCPAATSVQGVPEGLRTFSAIRMDLASVRKVCVGGWRDGLKTGLQ